MGAQPAMPSKPAAVIKKAQKIKQHIDNIIGKMQKNSSFSPTRNQLEEHAEDLIDLINDHHDDVVAHESHLKAAIIDLTEVPEMAPQMQRIAYLTALKDASQKMQLFLSCC